MEEHWTRQSSSPLLSTLMQNERDPFQDPSSYTLLDTGGQFNMLNEIAGTSLGVNPLPSSQGSQLPVSRGNQLGTIAPNRPDSYGSVERSESNGCLPAMSRGNRRKQSHQAEALPAENSVDEPTQDDQSNPSSNSEEKKPQDSRYVNTMVALEKAGLLEITLKTADLIKKNEALQKEIDVLEDIVKAAYALYSN